LNDVLIDELKRALRTASADERVRVIVLSGTGSDFCAGADLASLQKISAASVDENLEDARSLMELFTLIRGIRVPVIAAVRGRALAGGCGLALACDIVIAEKSARFGFPEVKIGFVPAMVMAILRRNISEKRAFELAVFGEEISAGEASAFGLINYTVDDSDLESQTETLAARLSKTSKSALSLTKGLLYQMDGLSFDEALENGADINVTGRFTEDAQQGVARFLSKIKEPS
jgi:methylglutaconyl-CoA hydratase